MRTVIEQITYLSDILTVLEQHKDCLPSLSKGRDYRRQMAEKFWKHAVFISAKIDDSIVGFCAFYTNDISTRTAFISMIAVHKKYRRLHVGDLLLNNTIEIAHKYGMKQIMLEVNIDNKNAIYFYKKNGFDFVGNKSDCNIAYMLKVI